MAAPAQALLGLIQGPAELLPVSSSGHVEAARRLWGLEGDEVALHAGSLAALVIGCRSEIAPILRHFSWRRLQLHLLAGGIPATLGYARERQLRKKGQSPQSQLFGTLLVGGGLLLVADRARGERSRWDAGPADGLWLGLAQAAALWPGVSRNGATLAAARLRGFAADEANPLSREVGVPVTLGAVAMRCGRDRRGARRGRRGRRRWASPPLDIGPVTAFASALAALPVLRVVDRGGPLWPWGAERIGLALVLLRQSRP